MLPRFGKRQHKIYGSVTVGERGQVSIPAEARRDLDITPNTKLLVFSGPNEMALMLVKTETVTEFISQATARLSHLEQMLQSEPAKSARGKRKRTT
jgi:AbrB family looped-hinge helix DNA binding protein